MGAYQDDTYLRGTRDQLLEASQHIVPLYREHVGTEVNISKTKIWLPQAETDTTIWSGLSFAKEPPPLLRQHVQLHDDATYQRQQEARYHIIVQKRQAFYRTLGELVNTRKLRRQTAWNLLKYHIGGDLSYAMMVHHIPDRITEHLDEDARAFTKELFGVNTEPNQILDILLHLPIS